MSDTDVALTGAGLPEAVVLLVELLDMSRFNHTEGEQRDVYLCDDERPRVVEIGKRLNVLGDFPLMQAVCDNVRLARGALDARHLELAWDGIGDWRC